jgi:D,D-heptose 1,7-bisphosphate phosphatase
VGKPAVFLDRDGVINTYVYNPEFGTVDSPSNPDEFQLNTGVAEAVSALRAMGVLVIVVSNQPGIAKGKFSAELLKAMTAKMLDACGNQIDDVYYCLHHPQASNPQYLANCECRKPKPGMLLEAAAKWEIDLGSSYMVGDGLTDVLAGRAAGTQTILVNERKCYLCEEMARYNATPNFFAKNLAGAVNVIKTQNEKKFISSRSPHELHRELHRGSHSNS